MAAAAGYPDMTGTRLRDLPTAIGPLIAWCRAHGLLAGGFQCPSHNCHMQMVERNRDESIDQVYWRCTRCRTSRSIRQGSFFSSSHLSLDQIVHLMYFWSHNIDNQQYLMHELDINSEHTVVDWKNFVRDVCAEYLIAHPTQIGGPGVTVEIDESLLVRRKYHVGHAVNQQWVFGGVEVGSNECFMVPVDQRDAPTLLPIIQQYILPGTTVVSDLWGAYNGVNNLPQGYNHLTVNHHINFVDPNTGACTNHQESTWQKAKQKHKQRYGTHRHHLESYLFEFCWRRKFNGVHSTQFHNLVNCIREIYPV